MAGMQRLAPVTGRARIEILDILRGIAILGILYMNIPFMGAEPFRFAIDARSIGWSVADRNSWAIIQVVWDGTQRCLLEFLFGAGMMVLTARAMEPDGPVAVADLYYRRNLWLLLFGFVDIFVLLWPGDILHIYALAALFLFPFRTVSARWLVALGLLFASFTLVSGTIGYIDRVQAMTAVDAARAKQAAHRPLAAADRKAIADWQKILASRQPTAQTRALSAKDDVARTAGSGVVAYVTFLWSAWMVIAAKGSVVFGVIEAFSTMLIGIALWKWRIIQGGRTTRFYLVMMVASYGIGLTARAIGVGEMLTFSSIPKTIWATNEYARIAVGLGHVAAVNLIVRTTIGRAILSPFRAAGRTAFSLYFLQQVIGVWILFAPFVLGWWGRYSWGTLTGIATVVIVFELVIANIWVRYFNNGPLEWAWRSLAYVQRQPFRRRQGVANMPEPLPGPNALPV